MVYMTVWLSNNRMKSIFYASPHIEHFFENTSGICRYWPLKLRSVIYKSPKNFSVSDSSQKKIYQS